MKVTLYLSEKIQGGGIKERELNIGNALKSGFEKHGDQVVIVPAHEFVRPDWDTHLAVVIGIKGHSKRICEEYRRGARPPMLVDKSYFGRTEYVRLSVGGFQPPYAHAVKRQPDRWHRIRDEFHIEVKPKQKGGRYFIYAGSSQKYCDWHDLGDATTFAESVCHSINKTTHSEIPLLYRPKPSWVAGHPEDAKPIPDTQFSGPDKKLGVLLPDCKAVITHGSNAAVEAVIAGVPAIVISKNACAADVVAEKNIANIRDPFFPEDVARLQWLYDLAYLQFNLAEIAAGLAWEITAPHTMKTDLDKFAAMAPDEAVIAQYRAMHESHKMFRGSSLKGHVEAIADLVAKHLPTTLLDYGSGKGRQYDDLNLHERWGGLKPHCYDPGYEPFAKKPKGKFDGVICTDVAEHIPPETVDAFLRDVIGYAEKFAFFCIFTEPSRKYLPDGRNCHLTCKPPVWWIERLCAISGGKHINDFMVRKPLLGGATQDFKHSVIRSEKGPEIVVTFRGEE